MDYTNIRNLTFLCALVACPLAASAQSVTEDTSRVGPSERFGRVGQLAISSDAAITIQHTSTADSTRVTLGPAADYFVIDGLSIGGFILLDYTTADTGDVTRFGIGPRVGYNLAFTDLLSTWPKLGFSLSHTSFGGEVEAGEVEVESSESNTAIALNAYVPIMFHPATHFFAGFGPFIDADLSGDQKVTTYGLKLTLGGWMNI